MKVIHLEAGRHLYGGAAQVAMLLRGLQSMPGEHVLVCSRDSAIAALPELAGCVQPIAMRGDLDPSPGWRLGQIIRRQQADLVHVHSRRGADIWGAWAAARAGRPAVLSRRVDNPESVWLKRWKYRRYEKVIAISEGIRRLLIEREGLPADRVVCVPSAVDSTKFRPRRLPGLLAREFGLAADERAVGMIAQFIERKGHRILLEALPAVLESHPRTRVLLFGQGPLKPEIQRTCAQAGLSERVVFAGVRDDLARIVPNLDLVVHPASREGLGVALLEAAACGVAIVAVAAGGIPEIVRDGYNGTLLQRRSAARLAVAIGDLLDDPQRAARYGENGRQLALERFSPTAMVEGNYRVYRELLDRNGIDFANRQVHAAPANKSQ